MRKGSSLPVGAAAVICLFVAGAHGQPTGRVEPSPVVKMGVNDSRSGTISPRGDVDTYEFTVTRPGIFHFSVLGIPKDVVEGDEIAELRMTLTGPPGFTTWDAFTREDAKSYKSPEWALKPGTYTIRIKDYFDDAASADSYTIQTVFTEIDDPGEPNDTPASATRLKTDRAATGFILPSADKDYYRMTLLMPGRVKVVIRDIPPEIRNGKGTKALYLGLLNQDGRLLREYTSRPRQETLETEEEPMNRGTYYLVVRDFKSDDFSASPYTITATFPGTKGELSEEERGLIESIAAQFRKTGDDLDTEERDILERLENRFLQD